MVDAGDLTVPLLGEATIDSPFAERLGQRRTTQHYVDENDRVLFDDTLSMMQARTLPLEALPSFEPAGARKKIFFPPERTRVGIVTCGGLCPGLNDVIRAMVLELTEHYGVDQVFGFRHGFRGMVGEAAERLVPLDADMVAAINDVGGTLLGSSRGQQNPERIVDTLIRHRIDILFVIGGDGTMRGALAISRVLKRRRCRTAVVGVPKTIDNDIPFLEHSFGFQTAFSKATESIRAAHVEATASPYGVGLVKLMGRHSGFIACYAALAQNDAQYVLIPEVPFDLHGEDGFLEHLVRRVRLRGNAVVVVAEGAGQEFMSDQPVGSDLSGNVRLHDIGLMLRHTIAEHFAGVGHPVDVKYFDPSYTIRSVPANPYDSVLCLRLAQAAVHGAMAGRTEMVVGRRRGRFVHIPMPLLISARNTVDPNGDLWLSVLEATGQPPRFGKA